MTGNSQNFARIKLGIKLISDSVKSKQYQEHLTRYQHNKCSKFLLPGILVKQIKQTVKIINTIKMNKDQSLALVKG